MRGLLVLVIALALRPAAAQDDVLLPGGRDVFYGTMYDAYVGQVFYQDPSACRENAQTILVRSFVGEATSGLCRTPDGYSVFAAAAESSLWTAGFDTTGTTPWDPNLARRVQINRFEAPVDSVTATCILASWRRAVREARTPAPESFVLELSTDGDQHYFASFDGYQPLTALARNPQPGSVSGALSGLGASMGAVAQRRAPASVLGPACARLERLLTALPAAAP